MQLAQLSVAEQELGRNWLHVEVAVTAVLETKLVLKTMGGKRPGEVRFWLTSCWPAARPRRLDSASRRPSNLGTVAGTAGFIG